MLSGYSSENGGCCGGTINGSSVVLTNIDFAPDLSHALLSYVERGKKQNAILYDALVMIDNNDVVLQDLFLLDDKHSYRLLPEGFIIDDNEHLFIVKRGIGKESSLEQVEKTNNEIPSITSVEHDYVKIFIPTSGETWFTPSIKQIDGLDFNSVNNKISVTADGKYIIQPTDIEQPVLQLIERPGILRAILRLTAKPLNDNGPQFMSNDYRFDLYYPRLSPDGKHLILDVIDFNGLTSSDNMLDNVLVFSR